MVTLTIVFEYQLPIALLHIGFHVGHFHVFRPVRINERGQVRLELTKVRRLIRDTHIDITRHHAHMDFVQRVILGIEILTHVGGEH